MPKDPAQATLVGRSMLFCWQAVGWCVGVITEANGDKRVKVDGEVWRRREWKYKGDKLPI